MCPKHLVRCRHGYMNIQITSYMNMHEYIHIHVHIIYEYNMYLRIHIHAYSYNVVGRDWLKFDLISVGDDSYHPQPLFRQPPPFGNQKNRLPTQNLFFIRARFPSNFESINIKYISFCRELKYLFLSRLFYKPPRPGGYLRGFRCSRDLNLRSCLHV